MPEEYQQQIMMPSYNPANYNESVLRYQLEAEEFLAEIECKILAKKKKYNDDNTIELVDDPNCIPLINKAGWTRLRAHLRTGLDKMFALTDLTEEDVRKFTISSGRNIIQLFQLHWDEFEIKSIGDASLMEQIITTSIYASLRKSMDGTYIRFLTTTHQHSEHVNINQSPNQNQGGYMQQEKPNFLMRIFGKK